MRKRLIIIALFVALLAFSACSKDIRIQVPQADSVTVFYGLSSYALFSKDTETIEEVSACFDGLSLTPTDREMDVSTTFYVHFAKGEKEMLSVEVDQNGTFRVNGGQTCNVSRTDSDAFDRVQAIYNADGHTKTE